MHHARTSAFALLISRDTVATMIAGLAALPRHVPEILGLFRPTLRDHASSTRASETASPSLAPHNEPPLGVARLRPLGQSVSSLAWILSHFCAPKRAPRLHAAFVTGCNSVGYSDSAVWLPGLRLRCTEFIGVFLRKPRRRP
ncbi:unnamed protein product, partial [Iphiclides podalirius]